MSRLTFSSAFLRSDWSRSNSSCNGVVSIAVSALRSIAGTVATRSMGGVTGCSGIRQFTIVITAIAAATPVIVLAHQNSGDLAAGTARCSSGSGVTARKEASMRRSSSSETVTSIRCASSRSCLASLSIGLVRGVIHVRFQHAPPSHQVDLGPRCGPVQGFGNVVDRHVLGIAQPHGCKHFVVEQLPCV